MGLKLRRTGQGRSAGQEGQSGHSKEGEHPADPWGGGGDRLSRSRGKQSWGNVGPDHRGSEKAEERQGASEVSEQEPALRSAL